MKNPRFLLVVGVLWTSFLCSEGGKLSELEQELAGKGESYKSRVGRQWTTVITSSSTTTISTTTNCFVTKTAVTACGKKKRSVFVEPLTGEVVDLTNFAPTKYSEDEHVDQRKLEDGTYAKTNQLLEGEDDVENVPELSSGRQPRIFFVSYTTSTKATTSTSTSYTATSSLASIICTPSGWTIAQCNLG
eukprot:TRINITY_DN56288_c0_g1_i1.p1 TRINITY_DN56288_c0_g1~~TRINITY_DN56288_c0_g1_i1.p1  ORF type:complete len:189 (-),score=32.43 TRINITY_DN56288_c0_g1_i1:87-653(-)